jgi:hypothetical protein
MNIIIALARVLKTQRNLLDMADGERNWDNQMQTQEDLEA